MKKSKKLVSLFLALAFALSLMAMPALAATDVHIANEACPRCGENVAGYKDNFTYTENCPYGGRHTVEVTQVAGTCSYCGKYTVFHSTEIYNCGICR